MPRKKASEMHRVANVSKTPKTIEFIGEPFILKYFLRKLDMMSTKKSTETFNKRLSSSDQDAFRIKYYLCLLEIGTVLQENIDSLEKERKLVSRDRIIDFMRLGKDGDFRIEGTESINDAVHKFKDPFSNLSTDAYFFAVHNSLTRALMILEAYVHSYTTELTCNHVARLTFY